MKERIFFLAFRAILNMFHSGDWKDRTRGTPKGDIPVEGRRGAKDLREVLVNPLVGTFLRRAKALSFLSLVNASVVVRVVDEGGCSEDVGIERILLLVFT